MTEKTASERASQYNKDIKHGTKQLVKDLKNPIFLTLTLILVILFVGSFFVRRRYPIFYLSFLGAFNAFLIAWFARLDLVFLPSVFIFLTTFEHLTNLRYVHPNINLDKLNI